MLWDQSYLLSTSLKKKISKTRNAFLFIILRVRIPLVIFWQSDLLEGFHLCKTLHILHQNNLGCKS